jgi:CDP-diacylglycerol--serine O-phosphatidyltransferase
MRAVRLPRPGNDQHVPRTNRTFSSNGEAKPRTNERGPRRRSWRQIGLRQRGGK